MSVTRVIDAPVDLVWAVFTDPQRGWLSEVDDVEPVPPAAGEAARWWEAPWRDGRLANEGEPEPGAGVDDTEWAAELVLAVVEPYRACTIALAAPGHEHGAAEHISYWFTPVDAASTAVTAEPSERSTVDRPRGLGGKLFDVIVGGFAARTAEGALRAELDALAEACRTRLAVAGGPGSPAA